MPRTAALLVPFVLVTALALLAAPAHASGLYVVIEKTASTGEPLPVTIRSDTPRVVIRAWLVDTPGDGWSPELLNPAIALDRGETLAWLDPQRKDVPIPEGLRRPFLRPAHVSPSLAVPKGAARTVELALKTPGFYLIAVSDGRHHAYATGLVSDLGLVTKRTGRGLLAWAVHRRTGQPVEGAHVQARLGKGAVLTATTGANGLATLDARLPTTAFVHATWGRHLALGYLSAWHSPAATDRRVYVHAHQPAYRPGERVELKGIVRAVDAGRLRLDPAVVEATVTLLAPDEKEMAKTTCAISTDLGTFACGLGITPDAPTGNWKIVADVGGRSYEAPLKVDAYRKPAFEVRVTGDQPRVLAGAKTAFTVAARWYDGGALASAQVEWQLLYTRVDRELFPEDELVRLFFGTEREAYRPETLATGKGTLDAKGVLSVPVEAPSETPDGYLSLRATVTGPDRMAVAGSGRIGVSLSPVAVALETDRHLYGPEDVARVTVKVERADGRAAAGQKGALTVALAPEMPPGAPVQERWLHNLPFTTDDAGTAVVSAPLGGAGRYALSATIMTGERPRRRLAYARIHVWAAGDRTTPGHPGAGIRVVADRDAYVVGDEARLLVLAGGNRPVLATLERGGILRSGVLKPGEVAPIWTIPLTEAHVPNVYATFTMVDHGRLLTTTHLIRIPPRTRLLDTTVTPDVTELEPGATSGLTVDVIDHAGRAVEGAEVSVAIVDEALFALHQDPTAPVEAFFHPPRRNAVGTEALLDWRSVGWGQLTHAEKLARLGARTAGGDVPAAMREPSDPAAPAPSPPSTPPAGGAAYPGPTSAVPEPAPVEEAEAMEEALDEENPQFSTEDNGDVDAKKEGKGRRAAIRVREDFRTAIFWTPALRTDGEGRVRVEDVKYGDSLTRWRLTARGVDARTRVGTGTAFVRTRRHVSARVTLPRFLRAGDRADASVVFRNLTDAPVAGTWEILSGTGSRNGDVTLGPRALETVEATYTSEQPGEAVFGATLRTDAGGDAVRRTLSVLPRGIEKVEGHTVLAREGESTLTFTVPEHAESGTVSARVRLEPAYASAMLTSLPYLQGYPYGCTEQTLNRFVPLVAALEALSALGHEPTGLTTELPKMVDAGVKRLGQLQHADGGFGWWEHDTTDVGMTALVVRGLSRLQSTPFGSDTALAIRDRGAEALAKLATAGTDRLDATTRASLILALGAAGRLDPQALPAAGLERWRPLSPMGQALVLRAAVAGGHAELVAALKGLLDDEARREDGLLWWPARANAQPMDAPTRWQDDDVETTATVLLALLEAGVRPEVLDGGTRWLLSQRRGGDHWRSTRDTAAAVAFLAALVKTTGELGAGRALALEVDGKTLWEGTLTAETLFTDDAVVDLPAESLAAGRVVAVVLRCPEGAASASIALRYHETGPAIAAASNGFQVQRSFFRLEPVKQADRVTWRRTPVTETLPAGTIVECEIRVLTARPREYVMITSPHAGGFEPAREVGMVVEGRVPATEARAEAHDDRTMFFATRLAEGKAVFRHLLRATHAGTYTALPAQAALMYFPDVRGNSDGELWQVTPAGPVGRSAEEGGR